MCRASDLVERYQDRAPLRIASDVVAEVGMGAHVGVEIRGGALLQQPALVLEHAEVVDVGLVEDKEPGDEEGHGPEHAQADDHQLEHGRKDHRRRGHDRPRTQCEIYIHCHGPDAPDAGDSHLSSRLRQARMFLPGKECFDEQSLYHLSVSSGVKITQQGFLFFDAPIRLSEPSYPCTRTLDALCTHGNYTFLPCTRAPLTMLTDAPPPFDWFWHNEAKCNKLPSMYELHITPCDLRKGTSIVWSEGTVAVQHDMDMAYWPSLFVLLIMTWLIINLGETIALILEVKGSTAHNHNTVVLCAALVAIIVGCTPQTLWATDHDLVLYWCTVGYIGLYGLYHIKNQNTINIIVGCLILVSARFYQTNETPYVSTFLFLIAARFFQKACYARWGKSSLTGACWAWVRCGFMVADVAFFVLLYAFSFVPACTETTQAHLYLLGILFSAACLGMFVANFVKHKTEAALTSTSTEEG